MANFLAVPISSVILLSPERAVGVIRSILRAECGYAKLSPAALTISSRLTTADGGIDAEVSVPGGFKVPTDCIFQTGLSGFQIKAGTAFKPWTASSIQKELLNRKRALCSEVQHLLERNGRYTMICTGHDLTPDQRNKSRRQISKVFKEAGLERPEDYIEVLGASQIAEFVERYPGISSLLSSNPIHEAWILEEWQCDAHMANVLETSPEQSQIITQIRDGLKGEAKHIRILGEAGLGKTRIVLESVKDHPLALYVLYLRHGSQFGQTKLFRQILKSGYDKPLILVIDELPESELSDIWRHLKPLCGQLKIVSIDHGRDETHDSEIIRLNAPRLPDETIKKILIGQVGESRELDRWVPFCEGSPRVALAVADNLRANPGDILKPPTTVPIWTRYLHGYSNRNEISDRQIDCVAQHLSLFSRFGYEVPVGNEAVYIAELIRKVDPTIGWARFQEIIYGLRTRRVLQGSRTLFFVPKALQIYLWKQFWERYGCGFDFAQTFNEMPESLHAWFLNMFKFAGDAATNHVIDEILRADGIFSQREILMSDKGSQFLSTLAEANPPAVLRLLEGSVGKWSDKELLDFKENRQNLVWALEKIAVWPTLTVRAIQVLSRFSVNENASFSNNSSGILIGLFRIGPEAAATESSPEIRLPAMLKLLRSSVNAERRLGLKAMQAALDCHGMGFRVIGPEFQGLKERAKLWIPKTYEEWWQAKFSYFQVLINETRNWPPDLRTEVGPILLGVVEQLITLPPCTELAFQVLNELVEDCLAPPENLNRFFSEWQEYKFDSKHPDISKKIRRLERRYVERDLSSRFQRYVVDVDWMEWDESFRERQNIKKNRVKMLVRAMARRIARHPEKLSEIQHLLSPKTNALGLWYFGEQLSMNDKDRHLLQPLIQKAIETKHEVCLSGYLSAVRTINQELFFSTVSGFLNVKNTAWLGANLTLRFDYNDMLFKKCLDALEKRWINPLLFTALRFGRAIELIPPKRLRQLFHQLDKQKSRESRSLLIELLESIPFTDSAPFDSGFIFKLVSKTIPSKESRNDLNGYHWKNVCLRLIKWDSSQALPLLDVLLIEMGKTYRLSYDSNIEPLSHELVRIDPSGAWRIVKKHFEKMLPKWRSDLLNWLKGGFRTFDDNENYGAIVEMPVTEILHWIENDPENRASLMAHATPGTLDVEKGGRLTQELLLRYWQFDGVSRGISATFHSGGWSGPESAYLKRKRDKFRRWLSAGFETQIVQWIENEIEYLDRNIESAEIEEERSRFE